MLSLAILGAGHSARNVTRAAQALPGVRVTRVYNHHRARAETLAAEFNVPHATDDLRAVLAAPDVEAVVVCLPHHLHHDHALRALEAGKHVLCEKPLALTLENARHLVAEAAARDLQLGVYYQRRYLPAVQKIRAILAGDALGMVTQVVVHVHVWRDPPYYAGTWRGTWAHEGGGALVNQSIHWVDLLYYLFGPVEWVQATMDTRVQQVEVEDTISAILRFESGVVGTLTASTVAFPGLPLHVRVLGTKGSLILEGDRLQHYAEKRAPPTLASPVAPFDAHQAIIDDFRAAIEAGTPFRVPGRDALPSLAITRAIYAACREGCRVLLADQPTGTKGSFSRETS